MKYCEWFQRLWTDCELFWGLTILMIMTTFRTLCPYRRPVNVSISMFPNEWMWRNGLIRFRIFKYEEPYAPTQLIVICQLNSSTVKSSSQYSCNIKRIFIVKNIYTIAIMFLLIHLNFSKIFDLYAYKFTKTIRIFHTVCFCILLSIHILVHTYVLGLRI